MAEIRKHKPANDAIARALSAAMGEPVRPVEPGNRDDDATDAAPAAADLTPEHDATFAIRVPQEAEPDPAASAPANGDEQ